MPTGIAILGCGTIGASVATMLLRDHAIITRRSGQRLQLRHVIERDIAKARDAGVPRRLISDTFQTALDDPDTQIVIELIGGLEPARSLVLQALKAGKHVVTANKYLLAIHGTELLAAARKAGRALMFEASCGGTIPIILALTRGLLANDISRVVGIVNGTCNYVLTQMTEQNEPYADALKAAQAAGFAERDPTFDVNGMDSAHKLAVLAGLAFGVNVPFEAIERAGIDTLQDEDLGFAREFGYVCKLLAIGDKADGGIALSVSPTFVPREHMLAAVRGSFNAISVTGHASGETLYYGRGAGGMPTASAVLADCLDVALGSAERLIAQLPAFQKRRPAKFLPARQIVARYYLRVTALDAPGVLAKLAGILSNHGISVAGLTQHERRATPATAAGTVAAVVVMTHETTGGAVAKALKEIDALPEVAAPTVRIRVL
jgi:homoserine dehydrogenase